MVGVVRVRVKPATMSLLRSAQRSNQLLQPIHHFNGSILRHLSTTGQNQPPLEPFPQTSNSSGPVYGRLFGITKHTLKTDIINMLEGSNLTPDNVKVAYNRLFNPQSMLLQFHSMADYATAVRQVTRRGRIYKVENIGEKPWETTQPYNGKCVLAQGLPMVTSQDDLHRFFEGFNYDSTTTELFLRSLEGTGAIKMALLRFDTQVEAFNAAIQMNGKFLHNTKVVVRVLQ